MAEAQDDISFLKSYENSEIRIQRTHRQNREGCPVCKDDPVFPLGPRLKSRMAKKTLSEEKQGRMLKRGFRRAQLLHPSGPGVRVRAFRARACRMLRSRIERASWRRAGTEESCFWTRIGELGLDEQAMLLRAIEEKRFLPLGADQEAESSFELICGTNRDLGGAVKTEDSGKICLPASTSGHSGCPGCRKGVRTYLPTWNTNWTGSQGKRESEPP